MFVTTESEESKNFENWNHLQVQWCQFCRNESPSFESFWSFCFHLPCVKRSNPFSCFCFWTGVPEANGAINEIINSLMFGKTDASDASSIQLSKQIIQNEFWQKFMVHLWFLRFFSPIFLLPAGPSKTLADKAATNAQEWALIKSI